MRIYKLLIIPFAFFQLNAAQEKMTDEMHEAMNKAVRADSFDSVKYLLKDFKNKGLKIDSLHLKCVNSYDMAILLLINIDVIDEVTAVDELKRQYYQSSRYDRDNSNGVMQNRLDQLTRCIRILMNGIWAQYGRSYIEYLKAFRLQLYKGHLNQDWNPLIPELSNMVIQYLPICLEVYPGAHTFDHFVASQTCESEEDFKKFAANLEIELDILKNVLKNEAEFDLGFRRLELLEEKLENLEDIASEGRVKFYKWSKPGCCIIS